MRESTFQSGSTWTHPAPLWIGWASIFTILVWILCSVRDGFFIPWWFNTDEVAFFYETVRQLRLEPTQTFFDIPGTPSMSLISLATKAGTQIPLQTSFVIASADVCKADLVASGARPVRGSRSSLIPWSSHSE